VWNVDSLPVGPGLIKRFGRLDLNFDDPRFDNRLARTFPRAHAATHEDGGTDELTLAQSQITGLAASLADLQDQIDALTGSSGGGLVKVDSDTFSAQSPLVLPSSLFDSTFDDYLVRIVATGSTNILATAQLLASGTPSSTGYDTTRIIGFSSTGAFTSNEAGTDEFQVFGCGSGHPAALDLYLAGPAIADYTSIHGHASFWYNTTGNGNWSIAGIHSVATAYDSIQIIPDTGTISGRWTVFGIAK
jgi:hypothetical protein